MKKTFLIGVIVCLLVVSGCGQIKKDYSSLSTHTDQAVTTTITTTTQENISTSTIDKNDASTWPRFEFKELGFSVQLPFEKDMWYAENAYWECKSPKDLWCFYSKNKKIYKYDTEIFDRNQKNFIYIGAISKDFFPTDLGWMPTMIYDFYPNKKNYNVVAFGNFPTSSTFAVRPIKKYFQAGSLVVVINWKEETREGGSFMKVFDNGMGTEKRHIEASSIGKEDAGGIILKLNKNKKFKVASIVFENVDLLQIDQVVKSIKFD